MNRAKRKCRDQKLKPSELYSSETTIIYLCNIRYISRVILFISIGWKIKIFTFYYLCVTTHSESTIIQRNSLIETDLVISVHDVFMYGVAHQSPAMTGRGSVADPDPHVFGPPGSGSTSQRYGSGSCSGSGSLYHRAKIVRKTLIHTIL
jgi:hypothetical protein